MRHLNLGCGDRYAPGWHNVDLESPHRKDEIVDLTGDLPWPDGEFDRVYLGHVLEHLRIDEAGLLLKRLLRVVKPGGIVMVVGPDLNRAQVMAEAGTLDVTMDSLRFGASRWPGDEHHWECTGDIVVGLLKHSGWSGVTEVGIENVSLVWPVADRRPLWQCAVEAWKAGETE